MSLCCRTLSSMLQRSGVSALHQTFRFGSTTGTDSSTQTGGEICCIFMLQVCESSLTLPNSHRCLFTHIYPTSTDAPGRIKFLYPFFDFLFQFIQRTLNQFSAEALITVRHRRFHVILCTERTLVQDFIRHAIEAHRSRGNPPASDFAINKLDESIIVEVWSIWC